MASSDAGRGIHLRHRCSWLGLSMLLAAACQGPPPPEDSELATVATASDGEVSVELLARGAGGLLVGRNTIALRLSDDATGSPITSAAITQAWVMSMGGASHDCPATDPVDSADADGLFLATVLLPMPSGDGASWASAVSATPDGGAEHQLRFGDLAVSASELAKSIIGDDGGSYFVSLSFAEGAGANVDPIVGGTSFVLTVHAQDALLHFSPADDLAVAVTTEMQSMGHGGAAQGSPAYRSEGEYVGRLDFTMPGAWVVSFTLTRDGARVGVVDFDVAL